MLLAFHQRVGRDTVLINLSACPSELNQASVIGMPFQTSSIPADDTGTVLPGLPRACKSGIGPTHSSYPRPMPLWITTVKERLSESVPSSLGSTALSWWVDKQVLARGVAIVGILPTPHLQVGA